MDFTEDVVVGVMMRSIEAMDYYAFSTSGWAARHRKNGMSWWVEKHTEWNTDERYWTARHGKNRLRLPGNWVIL